MINTTVESTKKSAMMTKQYSAKVRASFGIMPTARQSTIMNIVVYQPLMINGNAPCVESGLPTFNSIDAVDVFHFDFQRNLPMPKLTVGQQFYMRLLWTYLFGIYSASTKIMMAYMWHELIA